MSAALQRLSRFYWKFFQVLYQLVLEDAVHLERSKNENELLKRSLQKNGHFGEMLGNSKAMEDVRKSIYRLSGTDHHVLIKGETGVGKELVARLLHNTSSRKDAPFVPINCATLSETLLESESYSDMRKARLLMRMYRKKAFLKKLNMELYFLMKLEICPTQFRQNCCGYDTGTRISKSRRYHITGTNVESY